MKILIVPAWLKQSVASANLPPSAVLSLSKLAAILSTDDVAFYFALQKNLGQLIPDPVFQSIGAYSFDDLSAVESCETWSQLQGAYQAGGFKSDDTALWFGPLQEPGVRFGLTSDLLADDVIAISPYTLETDDTMVLATQRFYERLLGQLNLVQSFETVAKTDLFRAYVRLL